MAGENTNTAKQGAGTAQSVGAFAPTFTNFAATAKTNTGLIVAACAAVAAVLFALVLIIKK